MRLRLLLLAAGLLGLADTAQAQQEPFGQDIDGWKFTQAPHPSRVICRAFSEGRGQNIIGRTGDGRFYVSVPAQGIPRGRYPESTISIGGRSEPIDADSDGARFVLHVDDDQIGRIIRARGYQWRGGPRGAYLSGTVAFNNSVGAAIGRLRECSRANGGR